MTAAARTVIRVWVKLDRRRSAVRRGDQAGASDAPASWPRILVAVDEVVKTTVRDLGDDRAARGAKQAATRRLGKIARLRRSVYIHLACCPQ